MPAALTFPIGSRFYDWRYESEPEPFMNGRRIYHARGQGARRLEQHQRDDLPARQPAGLRALGRRPGHGDLGLRALPAVLQADGDLPRRGAGRPVPRPRRAARARARPGAPARCSRPSSRRRSRPATRSPTTSTATGRRASRRSTATSTDGRRLSRRARLPAPGHGPAEPRGADPRASSTRVLFEGTRAVGVEYRRGRGAPRPGARAAR